MCKILKSFLFCNNNHFAVTTEKKVLERNSRKPMKIIGT